MKRILSGVAALAVLVAILRGWRMPAPGDPAPRLELAPITGAPAFARATEVLPFHLPEDHGPHFEFQTEWWYFTGHLLADFDRRFGFQLTFFRRGLAPGPPPSGPGLSTNQVYFAHFALADIEAGTHTFAERWSRGAAPLAGARGQPFAVWLEDWRVEAKGDALRLSARDSDRGLALTLAPRKPLALHGDRGLSAKSDEPGNASYYVGYTRLEARGELSLGAQSLPVRGLGWFDHEWSTSALGPGVVGWDWFSLQLDDGRELMFFRLRREDGTVERVSGGTLVERDGRTKRLGTSDLQVEVLDRWTSPHTHAVYPARWRLRAPGLGLDLELAPWLADQEMHTSFTYWEGAVRVTGQDGGRPLSGNGYVELTGYARSMQGVF